MRAAKQAPTPARKSAPAPAPNATDKACGATTTNNTPGRGVVKWFNPAIGQGFISLSPALAELLNHPRDQDLIFSGNDIAGFDPYRLNGGDEVSFVATHDGRGWRAVNVSVLESRAEIAEQSRLTNPGRPLMVLVADVSGVTLGGYTMPGATADKFMQAVDKGDGSLAFEVEDALFEKISKLSAGDGGQAATPAPAATPARHFPQIDLETAVGHTTAVMKLLENYVCYDERGSLPERLDGDFKCGIVSIVSAAQKDLRQACDDSFAAAQAAKGGAR